MCTCTSTTITVKNLADRIEIEARRSRFAAPGQDLELNREEQQELLDTLKATASSWQEEDRDALHELQLALAFQTSRPEQSLKARTLFRSKSRRPDSNRDPFITELWTPVAPRHRESFQALCCANSSGLKVTLGDPR
jgi:hypothetical protein